MRRPGLNRIIGGVECKRFDQGRLVNAPIIKGARGAPAVGGAAAKPYVITTSDFNSEAHQMAEAQGAKPVHLMNGSQLVRYITYIRGSLHDGDDMIAMMSPQPFCGRDKPSNQPTDSAKILAIANNKGGVGKTTTAYYLGAALTDLGKRVLLIDLDGQANLTGYCLPGLDAGDSSVTAPFSSIAQYFSGQQPLQALIMPTSNKLLSIIPSDPNLNLRDLGGTGRPDVELQFAHDVQELGTKPLPILGGKLDWIIIDTPPAMSVFTRAGLAAAQYVLAPMRPRRLSLPGTRNMLATLRTVNALTKNSAAFLGTVITHWDGLILSQNFEDLLLPAALQEFGGEAFKVKIPIDNDLEALGPGANTNGVQAYKSLAGEVLKRV